MKKYKKYIYLILCMLFISSNNVHAETYNYIRYDETHTPPNGVVYDITKMDYDDNTYELTLYGWAFNKGNSNNLGGVHTNKNDWGITDNYGYSVIESFSSGETTTLQMALSDSTSSLSDSSDKLKFNITYANGQTSGDLIDYNFTYWNCFKIGDTCIYNPSVKMPQNLRGGFKATINLKDVQEYLVSTKKTDKDYYILLYVNNAGSAASSFYREKTWFSIGVYNGVITSGVEKLDGKHNNLKIEIGDYSTTATTVVSAGMPRQASGAVYDSNKYFEYNKSFAISARTTASKPSGGGSQYSQTLFGLNIGGYTYCSVETGNYCYQPGSSSVAYAPASWVQLDGSVKLSFNPGCDPEKECCFDSNGNYDAEKSGTTKNYRCKSLNADGSCNPENVEKCNKKPTEEKCAPGYKGVNGVDDGTDTPFVNYYMFLAYQKKGVFNKVKTDTNTTNSNFNDAEIFEQIVKEANPGKILSKLVSPDGTRPIKGETIIIEEYEDAKEFYENLKSAVNSSKKYISDGGKYYIAHNGLNPSEISKNAVEYAMRSINVDTTISHLKNSTNTGYNFTVSRTYPLKENLLYLHQTGKDANDSETLYMPAMYKMSYCYTDEELPPVICEDETQPASCASSDSGTEMKFREDDNLKECTLDSRQPSGFTMIQNNSYCSVACKDDLTLKLPTHKEAMSGGYFKLDNYIPEISSTRTCVTSQINFDGFKSDIESYGIDALKPAYNDWQDMKYIVEQLPNHHPEHTETSQTCTYDCSYTDEDGNKVEQECEDTQSGYKWKVTAINALNNDGKNNNYIGDSGTYYYASEKCSADGTEDQYNSILTDYINKRNKAENKYKSSAQTYVDIVNEFNACYSWTDPVQKAKNSSGTISAVSVSGADSKDYRYVFEPKLKFATGSNTTPSSEDYSHAGDKETLDTLASTTETYYWGKNARGTVDNEYTNSSNQINGVHTGGSLLNEYTDEIKLFNCPDGGTKCTTSQKNVEIGLNTESYLKRIETISYRYHLHRYATNIPSGTLEDVGPYTSNAKKVNQILLEQEAVSININSAAGTYPYNITVENLIDAKDKRSEDTSEQNNYLDRMAESDLGSYDAGVYVCDYEIINDVVTDTPKNKKKYNFFYRVIDMSNINPVPRNLGYNWTTAKAAKAIARMQEADADYQVLTSNRGKMEFTLTPAIMRQIRSYNSSRNSDGGYSDWDLVCHDTDSPNYYCKSNFLTCLAGGTGDGTNASCAQIFGNVLTTSGINSYNIEDARTSIINNINSVN